MNSSNGTIPQGLKLYSFKFPDGDCLSDKNPDTFLESDAVALSLGKAYGATSIIHAISGRELLPQSPQ